MTADNIDPTNETPIINMKATNGLADYFCPFCSHKLFRGKITTFNLVCSNCNRLVRSEKDYETKDKDQL